MKAAVWHGRRDVRVDEVPDPVIKEPTDAIIEVTSTGLCGSDLHLYEVLAPFMTEGDILGHEPMGIVREVGSAVPDLRPGDRVVVPFNIACGAGPSTGSPSGTRTGSAHSRRVDVLLTRARRWSLTRGRCRNGRRSDLCRRPGPRSPARRSRRCPR